MRKSGRKAGRRDRERETSGREKRLAPEGPNIDLIHN